MKIETLNKLKLWVSPVTKVIYLGTHTTRQGTPVATGDKRPVTDEVLAMAAQHLCETDTEVEFPHGYLRFIKKEAPPLQASEES